MARLRTPAKVKEETLKLYEQVAMRIGREKGIDFNALRNGSLHGSYVKAPYDAIEFFFHEVGHSVVMGKDLEDLPDNIVSYAGDTCRTLSQASADSIEIDTAVVTFLTGRHLRLWANPGPILDSCFQNLIWTKLDEDDDTDTLTLEERLEFNFRRRCLDGRLIDMATNMVQWFRAQVRKHKRCQSKS